MICTLSLDATVTATATTFFFDFIKLSSKTFAIQMCHTLSNTHIYTHTDDDDDDENIRFHFRKCCYSNLRKFWLETLKSGMLYVYTIAISV